MPRRATRLARILYRSSLYLLLPCLAFSLLVNLVITYGYNELIFTDLATVPLTEVALVLGTSRKIYGRPNLYYDTRIQAALELYQAGKVRKLLLSGDNGERYYDEPTDMKNDLLALGVPEEAIFLDFAGFRTLDSIIRAQRVFGLNRFIVVSQPFHCRRALFIARSKGIEAIAYATPLIHHPARFRVMFREFFARIMAGIDVWLINTEPKYLTAQGPAS